MDLASLSPSSSPHIDASSLGTHIDSAAAALEAQVIAWRRDLHEHPELGNREFRTAAIVAAHLQALGLDSVPQVNSYSWFSKGRPCVCRS